MPGSVTYYTIAPPPKLAGMVRSFWVLESDAPYTHYSIADACPELLFHCRGRFDELLANGQQEKSFISGLHGAADRTRRFHIDRGFALFGVYFYPQAIPFVFGMPASELINEMPDLNTLLKAAGNELEEQIMLAADHVERAHILSAFIEKQLAAYYREEPPVVAAIHQIIRDKGMGSLQELARAAFLSERQLERQFKQYAGFSPKRFSRIVRFQSAAAHYGTAFRSLTEIAYACGYYDQSHFIHDFKAFSGQHPGVYFSGKSEATAWRD